MQENKKMNKKIHILFLILGIQFFPQTIFPQEVTIQNDSIQDNLGNVNDEFQEYFFEALKQKAIENPEKAISSLEKCLELKPEMALLYVELGKNYRKLKKFDLAENNFKIALTKNPEELRFIFSELFDIYSQENQYEKAIETAKELVKWDNEYYSDLANLYMMIKKPKLALATLKKVDSLQGPSEYTQKLRQRIFEATDDWKGQIAYLQQRITQTPENLTDYLQIVNIYAENGKRDEAFLWAKKLEAKAPNSEEVHVALYQLYLENGETEKAIISLKKALSGTNLEEVLKVKLIKDFVAFTKQHPEYENTLTEILNLAMQTGESLASNKELGDFYYRKDKLKALEYYTAALKDNFNDVETIEKTLVLQLELSEYSAAIELSKNALTVFPSRPKLYLSQGIAYTSTQKFSEALESFDFGLSYLIDNTELEAKFYREMGKAYRGLLKTEKAVEYENKAEKLMQNSK